jgi:sirohydrochlorin cobaltochelatase
VTALILAGHGSHISPQTAGLVWSYVDQLRAWGAADEITACLWKETPAFSQVLDTVAAKQIVIVPVFTARGYFSATVIPAEMRLEGSITRRGDRTIYYTRTIGEHPYLAAIVRQRVENALTDHQINPSEAAVAVIGHGTRRSPESRAATRQQADTLRRQQLVAETVDVYLDDEPDIPSVYRTTQSRNIIAVPFFLAPGSHVTSDVPAALGINPDIMPATVNGRQVYYTPPVGTDDAICRLILELARDTGLPFDIQPVHDPWHGFPQVGAEMLVANVRETGMIRFGQLQLTQTIVRPASANSTSATVNTPAELRRTVRATPFRPLATSDDLPAGWQVPVTEPHVLPAAVETVYPGALADWAANRAGMFTPESLLAVSNRQVGMFRGIHDIPGELIEQAVITICGQCVRHATWFFQHTPADTIPCKSACNWWLSQVKEIAST